MSPPPHCERAQLISAARFGKAADVDRLIKGGANTEVKDAMVCAFFGALTLFFVYVSMSLASGGSFGVCHINATAFLHFRVKECTLHAGARGM